MKILQGIKAHLTSLLLLVVNAIYSTAVIKCRDSIAKYFGAETLVDIALGLSLVSGILLIVIIEIRRSASPERIKNKYRFDDSSGVYLDIKNGVAICPRCLANKGQENRMKVLSSGWRCTSCDKAFSTPHEIDDEDDDPPRDSYVNRWRY